MVGIGDWLIVFFGFVIKLEIGVLTNSICMSYVFARTLLLFYKFWMVDAFVILVSLLLCLVFLLFKLCLFA